MKAEQIIKEARAEIEKCRALGYDGIAGIWEVVAQALEAQAERIKVLETGMKDDIRKFYSENQIAELAAAASAPHAAHEALHTVHLIACMLNQHVVGHPVITLDPKLRELAGKVGSALGELYQAIGELSAAESEVTQQIKDGGRPRDGRFQP